MATFVTNFISCSSEKVNVISWGCGGAEFWHRIEAYDFDFECCLNACFFVRWTIFVGSNMWSFTTARILAAFFLCLGILNDGGSPHR